MQNPRNWLKLICFLGIVLAMFVFLRAYSPPLLQSYSFSQQIFDRHGTLLRFTLAGDQKYRLRTSLAEINPQFVDRMIAKEDRFYYWHMGFNPYSLVRGFYTTYLKRQRKVGASTITMQLARLISPINTSSITGKLQQLILAFYLELCHSKREILQAYCNLLPFGGNIEGIGAASLIYFNKPAELLNKDEAQLLSLIPQRPNQTQTNLTPQKLPFLAPHFTQHVIERYPHLSSIRTTLDQPLQLRVENTLQHYLTLQKRSGVDNGAVLVVDYTSRDILAMVGSRNFFDEKIQGQVNGTRSRRSPGSALKPLLFALALEQGIIHPESLLKDTPRSFAGFDPENFDTRFEGPLSATEALVRSRNVPAVTLTAQLNPSFYELLKRSQLRHMREPEFYGLALAVGGVEITMEELSTLYVMLANRGSLSPLRLRIDESSHAVPPLQLLTPESSFLVLQMLSKNPFDSRGYFDQFVKRDYPLAWKTGTSHGFRDAWTVGIAGNFVIAVWLGDFSGKSNPTLVGRDLAAPLFFSLVDLVKPAMQNVEWHMNSNLQVDKRQVCSISGDLPNPYCPHRKEAWFIPGTSPIRRCDIHRQLMIARSAGLRLCQESLSHVKKVYEVWPSDLMEVFRLAGVPKRMPPPFDPSCSLTQIAELGHAPEIVSPKKSVIYFVPKDNQTETASHLVPLRAIVDSDVRSLHWFVANELLGSSPPNQTVFWAAQPGKHLVRVIDDLGRSNSMELLVQVAH